MAAQQVWMAGGAQDQGREHPGLQTWEGVRLATDVWDQCRLTNNGKQPRRLFPSGRRQTRFPAEPHNTSLSFFLDFKGSDLWGIQGKVRDQECSKGRFRRWPRSTVLLHACFDDREGWMCFIVMRYRGWVVNSLEQGSRVARELDIAGAHHPEGHLEKSPGSSFLSPGLPLNLLYHTLPHLLQVFTQGSSSK